ncbi:winged helix-turn-helix transcriptional regulator [Chitinophaga flava]|uniref:Transcriptional regulator n=1 Tax=Chitinophaga flava TaxID=2259036 RepID=A0A365Y322_9BACT|nr:helix-turn-helix domain-containing protein [Chitinophaga flava]RBL92976.1 transcriptional regulator [Chitinophaga flava]
MENKSDQLEECPIVCAINVIGGKWKVTVLNFLCERTYRFKELERSVSGISPKVLTDILQELEDDGLITRKVAVVKPLRVEYTISPKGELVKPVLASLRVFAQKLM